MEEEAELSAELALVFAANSLMDAAEYARKKKNSKRMLDVAAGWIQLYDRIEPETLIERPDVGFKPTKEAEHDE